MLMMIPLSPHDFVLAFDIGSSSLRATICYADGSEAGFTPEQRKHTLTHSPDGGAEVDPHEVLATFREVLATILARAQAAGVTLRAVCGATLVGSLLGADKTGYPLTPIYTYADRRGAHFAARISDPAAYTERTGCYPHPSYAPIRLWWLAEGENVAQIPRWFGLGDYLLHALTGVRRISLSAASWSGLLNRRTNSWDAATFADLPVTAAGFSEVSDAPVIGVRPEWEVVLGEAGRLLEGIPIFPFVADGVASSVGSGCTTADRLAVALGTSGALRLMLPGCPPAPSGLFAYAVDRTRSLIGGALNDVGSLYAWLDRLIGGIDADVLAAAEGMPPDAHGLTILPFLTGERAPGWHSDAPAVFMGMTPETTSAHLLRAALEAVALRYAAILDRMRPFLAKKNLVGVVSGAPSGSALWVNILTDALNLPLQRGEREATLRGAVCLATRLQSLLSNEKQGLPLIHPAAEKHALYRAAAERQHRLYERFSDVHATA